MAIQLNNMVKFLYKVVAIRFNNVVKFLYKDVIVRVSVGNQVRDRILASGIRQGCPASGFFWASYII